MILIAAITEDNGLGYQGDLLYHIPEDLKRFQQLTIGHTVLMGRKTWESLPGRQPLVERTNVILTHQKNLTAPGFLVTDSIDEWKQKDTFVIGGEEVYRRCLSLSDTIYLTRIFTTKKADVFFPDLPENEWKLLHQSERKKYQGIEFCFQEYYRI